MNLFSNKPKKLDVIYSIIDENKDSITVARIRFKIDRIPHQISISQLQEISKTKQVIVEEMEVHPYYDASAKKPPEEELVKINDFITHFNLLSVKAKRYFLFKLNT